jgi:hypothetical protein
VLAEGDANAVRVGVEVRPVRGAPEPHPQSVWEVVHGDAGACAS